MRTLVINTYGGSLLLGAKAAGVEVIGSYEDVGFGTPIQRANFPDLQTVAMRKDWPVQDLSEDFVIAHPPCSAFSVQNTQKSKRGVDSSAFACTISVMDYALRECKAKGLAIESVVGALAGAWRIHQKFADDNGYYVYRILESGCMFGAQWRDRFWAVFIRKDAAPPGMQWTLWPRWQKVRDVIGEMSGPAPAGLDRELEKLKAKFRDNAGCDEDQMEQIFGPNTTDQCAIDDRLWKIKFGGPTGTHERWNICKEYVTRYASSAMILLNENHLCPVLLGSSWWYLDRRNVSEVAYKRLMGFPDDYIFPEGERRADNFRADMRTFLSKGVMPPIARWIIENCYRHLGIEVPNQAHPMAISADGPQPYVIEVGPNHIADFRIRKKTWGEARPALRHYDEHPITIPMGDLEPITIPRQPAQPPREPKPRTERIPRVGPRRGQSPWNAPEIEDALKETLFVRPNTADAYALYESHGYHRMGVRAGDVVLDIGAHIGCVASRAALVGAAKVVSIEPEPENFELLERNVRNFPAVVTLRGAVYGGDAATVLLNRPKRQSDRGQSTGTSSVLFPTRGDSVEVPRLDFRGLLTEHQPTVIKCDCEGGEFSLDWENLPESVRSVGIELHTRREENRPKAKAIIATLEAQGFKPVHNLNLDSNFSAIIAFLTRPVVGAGDPPSAEHGSAAVGSGEPAAAA